MSREYDFGDVARLPAPGDNAAIVTRTLNPGDVVTHDPLRMIMAHTILEGHRFAVAPIQAGEPVLSWGLPFGVALCAIQPGDYLCNENILRALHNRSVPVILPERANFADRSEPYRLDEQAFVPGHQVVPYEQHRYFEGFRRPGGRGVGTRNSIVLLGTTSRTAGFVRAVEERLRHLTEGYATLDGIVAVAHTEGGDTVEPNNAEFLLRTLAGFLVHPNVGAVLAIDEGDEPVNNARLSAYMQDHGYPLDAVPHQFLSLSESFSTSLAHVESIISRWIPQVAAIERTREPLSELKIALQCGGSDAFSGVSGNPLAAWVAAEILRFGGSANLAETDELIGAEAYVLKNARDLETARRFLATIDLFRERLSWHGATAEGNPSGGNNLRGLYNIAIKSIGAAMKRDPQVRLDYVIPYAERMVAPGYYFMDSPGNDLESIAGQVASGCNMIFFVTGNGSITNFPFVPTIKIVTTTGRYNLLSREMDVNAGEYLDGVPMHELGARTLDLTVRVASGDRSVGERAAHAQVSIWRNWRQRDAENLELLRTAAVPAGDPLPVIPLDETVDVEFEGVEQNGTIVPDQLGLIMPTSLCSGQIARKIATLLNDLGIGRDRLSRWVALPHTEGCGSAGGANEGVVTRAVLGHISHPLVAVALMLEHGCEKTHNDYYRNTLASLGLPPERYGWASVQADGGIESVTRRVEDWARVATDKIPAPRRSSAGLGNLRVGIAAVGVPADTAALALARVASALVTAGATVVVPESTPLLQSAAFRGTLLGDSDVHATVAYAGAAVSGFHVMQSPTNHWVETLTGLVATGVEIVIAYAAHRPVQGHRMVPVLQITADEKVYRRYAEDLDLLLGGDPARWHVAILDLLARVASRSYEPKLYGQGNTDFQLTRGLLGVST